MKKCKDCYHLEVCNSYFEIFARRHIDEDNADNCKSFIDKEGIIEKHKEEKKTKADELFDALNGRR